MARTSKRPFTLSLPVLSPSKGSSIAQGFDKLSPNGATVCVSLHSSYPRKGFDTISPSGVEGLNAHPHRTH